jgi:hypothetical protein
VSVRSLFGYQDEFGYYHVVGEVYNSTEQPVTDIELTIILKDASGGSLLVDDAGEAVDSVIFSPLLYTLAQGESSPFDYWLSVETGVPAAYEVTVTGQQIGEVRRAAVEVQNAQMVASDFGSLYLTGELVNLSGAPAQINSLAGAALDGDDRVVAASGFAAHTHALAPAGDAGGNDRTPFRIRLDSPGEVASGWAVYVDADQVDFTPFPVEVEIVGGYFDPFDDFHLIGTVTNAGDEPAHISLVAGLYAGDGTVLDADTVSVPFELGPGESLPYDFQYFTLVSGSPEQATRVDRFTVQVDPYWTFAAGSEAVGLETAHDRAEDQGGGLWTFTGEVVNSSEQALYSAAVVVAVYDAEGNLVATNWASVYPSGNLIAPGDRHPFEVTLYLDPDVSTPGLTFRTFAQGYVN